MANPIPSTLVDYLQQCLSFPSLTLITSVLDVPANWLVLRYLFAGLHGTEGNIQNTSRNLQDIDDNKILFRLDFATLLSKKRLVYIDGLTFAASRLDQATSPTLITKSLRLGDISHTIAGALQSMIGSTSKSEHDGSLSDRMAKTTVIIDDLDFVLASQAVIEASTVQEFVSNIRSLPQVHSVVLSCSADGPLLHNHAGSATPLERQHSAFLAMMAHQSQWVMQLRGLETGSAKDVTGILRASRGGDWERENENENELSDGEWLYLLQGDGSVKIWSRGQ